MGLRVMCRRGSISEGSGREALRGRETAVSREERGVEVCRVGGGFREERRIGGSKVWVVEEEWRERRFGERDVGEVVAEEGLVVRGSPSETGKFGVVGVTGGVAIFGGDESTMVFLQASHIPSVDLMGSLHVLQMATVVESTAGRCACFRVEKPKSNCGLPLIDGTLGEECGS